MGLIRGRGGQKKRECHRGAAGLSVVLSFNERVKGKTLGCAVVIN